MRKRQSPMAVFSSITECLRNSNSRGVSDMHDHGSGKKRALWAYIPLCCKFAFETVWNFNLPALHTHLVTILLILSPQPSQIIVSVKYYWKARNMPYTMTLNLFITLLLTFLAFCSMIVCVARDPGPVSTPESPSREGKTNEDAGMSLTEALMAGQEGDDEDEDYTKPGRWCRKCWAPKPERTHHCQVCDRCVLKMGKS